MKNITAWRWLHCVEVYQLLVARAERSAEIRLPLQANAGNCLLPDLHLLAIHGHLPIPSDTLQWKWRCQITREWIKQSKTSTHVGLKLKQSQENVVLYHVFAFGFWQFLTRTKNLKIVLKQVHYIDWFRFGPSWHHIARYHRENNTTRCVMKTLALPQCCIHV